MDYQLLQTLISFLGFLTVAITVYYLARQTKAMIDATYLNTYQDVVSQILEIDRLFIERPWLKQFFHYGIDAREDALDAQKYAEISSTAELIVDFLDNLLVQKKYMPKANWEGWRKYVIDLFATSPILCRFLEDKKDWYTHEIFQLMETGRAQRNTGIQPFPKRENAA